MSSFKSVIPGIGKGDVTRTLCIFWDDISYKEMLATRVLGTGFPRCVKIEHSYENFHKPKWHKAKKQLPLTYMEDFFECSQTHNSTCTKHN